MINHRSIIKNITKSSRETKQSVRWSILKWPRIRRDWFRILYNRRASLTSWFSSGPPLHPFHEPMNPYFQFEGVVNLSDVRILPIFYSPSSSWSSSTDRCKIVRTKNAQGRIIFSQLRDTLLQGCNFILIHRHDFHFHCFPILRNIITTGYRFRLIKSSFNWNLSEKLLFN